MKTAKIPKVKISNTDLKSFLIDQLEVDPYWDDLYNPRDVKKNKYMKTYKQKESS